MSEPAETITREALYAMVWKQPLRTIAKELGSNYLELDRLCRTLNVPKPPQGHWTRLRLGMPVVQFPLPEAGPDVLTEASLESIRSAQMKRAGAADDKVMETAERKESPAVRPNGATAPPSGPQSPPDQEKATTPKPAPSGKMSYSRQQLYEAVWSAPCQQLAKDLGISDVALAKTCKRLGVPRPTRGYWARVAAGQQAQKQKLPKALPEQERTVAFDLAANAMRRQKWSEEYVSLKGLEHLAVELELPDEETDLHPVAKRHQVALDKVKADDDGFVQVTGKDLFHCAIAQTNISRLCRALHALVGELDARGYRFKASPGTYGNLDIVKGTDRVSLRCSEVQEQVVREPSQADKRKPSWTWQLKEKRAMGKFSFEVCALGSKGRRAWVEKESRPLELLLGVVVEKVESAFLGFGERKRREAEQAKRREEQARRWEQEREEREKRRAEEEKQQQERIRLEEHETELDDAAKARRKTLVTAARQFVDGQKVMAFIEACEAQWRQAGGGKISKAQSEWLTWASEEAIKVSPFSKGYPNPEQDGHFDRRSIAVGGPYPEARELEDEEAIEPDPDEVKSPGLQQAPAHRSKPWTFWGSKW